MRSIIEFITTHEVAIRAVLVVWGLLLGSYFAVRGSRVERLTTRGTRNHRFIVMFLGAIALAWLLTWVSATT